MHDYLSGGWGVGSLLGKCLKTVNIPIWVIFAITLDFLLLGLNDMKVIGLSQTR